VTSVLVCFTVLIFIFPGIFFKAFLFGPFFTSNTCEVGLGFQGVCLDGKTIKPEAAHGTVTTIAGSIREVVKPA